MRWVKKKYLRKINMRKREGSVCHFWGINQLVKKLIIISGFQDLMFQPNPLHIS